jgi:hypothetical protein
MCDVRRGLLAVDYRPLLMRSFLEVGVLSLGGSESRLPNVYRCFLGLGWRCWMFIATAPLISFHSASSHASRRECRPRA